ncbi:DUF1549 domain-containing protein, partial [Rhodoblastus sp.]|uniref:DUF1549 domain-containing protein n=1 Tax=Rhodoblastus sp. TaxID=1962975 RepID=UPI0035B375A9
MSTLRGKAYLAFLLSFTSITAVVAAEERPVAPVAAPAASAEAPPQPVAAATGAASDSAQAKPAEAPAKAVSDAAPAPAQVPSPAQQAASGSQAQPAPAQPAPAQQAAAPAAPAAPTHWSYVPVVAPAIPDVQQKDWALRPLDAFVLAKLESKGLKPSLDTDRATFIRRATLDAWGLLPTPEEVANFTNDSSPKAYEKLVDRLLASPHYGERQGRRWLDLARYADSAGFQGDATRLNYYRYRDYVIASFNQDKPYSRFIEEQIAGDEIFPNNQEALIATGFLTAYPDNPNSRDLVQRKYQITTDMTDTVGSVFLGSTIGCARCHNHKTDKITMKDYYSLQAFFANTSTTEEFQAVRGYSEIAYQKDVAEYEEKIKDIRAQSRPLIEKYRDKAFTYHKERYLTDSRDAVFKAEKDWTPLDRWVNHRLINKNVTNDELIVNAYLRYVGEDKEAPGYGPETKADLEKWLKLARALQQSVKDRPEQGSDTITGVEELGHPDAP